MFIFSVMAIVCFKAEICQNSFGLLLSIIFWSVFCAAWKNLWLQRTFRNCKTILWLLLLLGVQAGCYRDNRDADSWYDHKSKKGII